MLFDSVDVGPRLERLVAIARKNAAEVLEAMIKDSTIKPESTIKEVLEILNKGK